MLKLYLIVIFSCANVMNIIATFDSNIEPWKTLTSEFKYIDEHFHILGFHESEQNALKYGGPSKEEIIAIKLLVGSFNYSENMLNKSSDEYISLITAVQTGLKQLDTKESWTPMESSVANMNGLPLVTLSLPSSALVQKKVSISELEGSVAGNALGSVPILNGSVQAMKELSERSTVYEIFLQLYIEPYFPAMNLKNSDSYQNMTDQMFHLIGTRIKNVFGEHYYRMVLVDFYPSWRTLIVRLYILLDPSDDNLYFLTNIWYSLDGFIHLGKFPLLPENVKVTECQLVLSKYFDFLNDRSYRRPLNGYTIHPMIYVTLPCVLGILLALSMVLALLHCLHRQVTKDLHGKI